MRNAAFLAAVWLCFVGAAALAHDGEHEGKTLGAAAAPYTGPALGGGSFASHNIELMAHMPLANTGGAGADMLGNDVWGWVDSTTGKEYALVGRRDGTAFVDVTNPASPTYLGLLPTHTGVKSDWRDIEVYQDYAFIGADNAGFHGIQVFDLAQLRGVTTPTTYTAAAHYNSQLLRRTHTLAINQDSGYLYANGTNTFSGGLHIVDIRNPLAPTFAGDFAAEGYVHDSQVVNYQGPDADYAGREIAFNSNSATINGPYSLTIVDVTTKSAPALVSKSFYPQAAYTHQGWLTPDHRYFLMDDELDESNINTQNPGAPPTPTRTHIWDVANLDAPAYVGFHEGTMRTVDHNLYIKGNLVYEANYESGLRVLETTNLAAGELTEVAYFDTYAAGDAVSFNGAWSPYPFLPSGTILVNDRQYGLFVLRFKPDVMIVGDMNGDGVVNNFDIQPLEIALTQRADYRSLYPILTDVEDRGDINGDGSFNNFDIQPLEILLTQNNLIAAQGLAAVPEPAGAVLGQMGLVALTLVALAHRRRRALRAVLQ